MNSQTARRPDDKRPTRSTQAKKTSKQTAFYSDTRRDGKPLIFGWGSHLSRHEKTAIQRVAIWSMIAITILLVLVVFVGFWINLNILIPNQPVASVNGQNIPQSDYRKLVILKGQLEENDTKGVNGLYTQRDALKKKASDQQKVVDAEKKKVDDLNKQIKDASGSKRTELEAQLKTAQQKLSTEEKKLLPLSTDLKTMEETTIPNKVALYNQSQIGNESIQWLQENILIQDWLKKQSADVKKAIEPTDGTVTKAYNEFKGNLPKSETYDKFLSANSISDQEIKDTLRVKVRRDNMQNYLASQITSPSKQVKVSNIFFATEKEAKEALPKLQSEADFTKIAKEKSVDNDSKDKGGDIGWLARGQYTKDKTTNLDITVDNWIFDSARKVGDVSPVLKASGTFRVVRITGIEASRKLEDAQLKALQTNALEYWVLTQKALPGVKVGQPDNTKLYDPMNMPKDIPSSAPTTGGTGVPGAGLPQQ